MVTARAEGLNEGDTVTFTHWLGSVDAVDGKCRWSCSGHGSIEWVRHCVGDGYEWSVFASLDVVYEEAPPEEGRKAYVDGDGNAVYLIAKDSGTVGVDDFLALVAALVAAKVMIITMSRPILTAMVTLTLMTSSSLLCSWGRTAAVSGTKPIVLLPGINENARVLAESG